ncbi:MAG: hypothetical protein HC890_16965, partial [Chloroflexaceae bacterium]|nr:hypothetical protein [Chloroflexaceae bacterium]
MSEGVSPCLSLAISRLATVGPPHFAIWVTRAPHPSGYVHCDRPWPGLLTQLWLSWQELFALHPPHVPIAPASLALTPVPTLAGGAGYGGRLMQEL